MPARVSITLPVYNEERALAPAVHKLIELLPNLPASSEIVIASNGSTDRTVQIASGLARQYSNVSVLDIREKGRGLALKRSWNASQADICAYMDCDLSTDLLFFQPLIQPILSNTHDISIGSRHLKGSRVTRSFKRSITSHCYNRLVRWMFRPGFNDAQCGFKAISKAAYSQLGPLLKDDGWFLDTELLVKANAMGFRINELPVSWIEGQESKVNIFKTAVEETKGLLMLKKNMAKFKQAHRGRN